MRKRKLLTSLVLALAVRLISLAQDGLPSLYHQWREVPSRELLAKGIGYIRDDEAYDSAMVCFTIVMNRYSPIMDDEEKGYCTSAFNNAGYVCFFHYGDYGRAYDYLSRALQMSEQLNDNRLACCALNLGNMFLTYAEQIHSENLIQTAIKYYQQGLNAALLVHDWPDFITLFVNLSSIQFNRNLEEGLAKTLDLFVEQQVPVNIANRSYAVLQHQAFTAALEKDYSTVRRLLHQQLQTIDTNLTPERYYVGTLGNICTTFEREGMLDSAINCCDQIMLLAEQRNMPDIVCETYEKLALFFRQKGDTQQWAVYYNKYVQKKDSLLTLGGLEQIGEKHFLQELQQEADHVERLQHERYYQRIIIVVSLLAVIITLALLFIVHRKNLQLCEHNRLLYQRMQQMLSQENSMARVKYQTSGLRQDDKEDLLDRIEKAMIQVDAICRADFSLEQLADMVGSKPKYVSQIINETYQKGFRLLLADQRIKVACLRLNDQQHYGHLTMQAISESVGFLSRTSFTTAFKRVTGLSPSEYLKAAKA